MSIFDNIVFDEFTILEYGVADREAKRSLQKMINDKLEKENKSKMNRGRHPELKDKEKSREEYLRAKSAIDKEYINRSSKKPDISSGDIRDIRSQQREIKDSAKRAQNAARDDASIKSVMRHNRRQYKTECTFSTNYLYDSSNIEMI